jgi:hypothetical protein
MDAAQRQRKLAAKAAKRKQVVADKKKTEVVSSSLAYRIAVAAKCPFVRCIAPSTLFEIGIGHVIVARALPSGLLGCGFFLIDAFCLGVKDAFYAEITDTELQSRLAVSDDDQKFMDVEPAYARKLIRDAAAYAAAFSLAAAKDTPVVEAIFGDIKITDYDTEFTFGKENGKPFFMSGPNDTPARIKAVTRTLQEHCGSDGWDFMVQI